MGSRVRVFSSIAYSSLFDISVISSLLELCPEGGGGGRDGGGEELGELREAGFGATGGMVVGF